MCSIQYQSLLVLLDPSYVTIPKLGRKPEMGIEAENEFGRYLILRQECGFGLTRHEIRVLAFNFMKKLGVTHRFCDLFFAMAADNYDHVHHCA
jgi:hypothetical protein